MEALARRWELLAPFPGALLVALFYGLDPAYGSFGYPAHGWSTFGVVAGWCLLLLGLSAAAPSQISRWLAVLAALSFIAGPPNPGAAATILFAVGFSLTALLILIAAATVVISAYGWKGRVAWSIALVAAGVAAASSLGYPGNSYVDSPARQIFGALILTPVFIGLGSIWIRLDRPSTLGAAAGTPASIARRFLAGFISWIIFGVIGSSITGILTQGASLLPSSNAGATDVGLIQEAVYAAEVVFLQILPTAVSGRTLGQWAVGIRVVSADDGSRPGLLRTIVRFVAFQTVPVVGLIYLMALLTQLRFGLGRGVPDRMVWDHASGTVVIAAKKTSLNEPHPPKEQPQVVASTRDSTWESYE
jgi:RDD family protein